MTDPLVNSKAPQIVGAILLNGQPVYLLEGDTIESISCNCGAKHKLSRTYRYSAEGKLMDTPGAATEEAAKWKAWAGALMVECKDSAESEGFVSSLAKRALEAGIVPCEEPKS